MPGQEKGQRPTWDEYFMKLAIDVASRASCKNVRAGAVIVADANKRIQGTGYNGAPEGIENCLTRGCRKENKGLVYELSLNSGECIGIHSEMNALAHITALLAQEFTLYTTIFPCTSCAKNLLPYKLRRVVYKKEYDTKEREIAEQLLKEKGILIEQLDMTPERYIELTFALPPVKYDVFSAEERERMLKLIRNSV